jgi:hypothetical protein
MGGPLGGPPRVPPGSPHRSPHVSGTTIGQEQQPKKKEDASWLLDRSPQGPPTEMLKTMKPFVQHFNLNGNVLFILKLNRIDRNWIAGRLPRWSDHGSPHNWKRSPHAGRRVPLFFATGPPFLSWPLAGRAVPHRSPQQNLGPPTGPPTEPDFLSHHRTRGGKGPPTGPPLPSWPFWRPSSFLLPPLTFL